jgi:4-amino-4-deoxy-L-arabinose transferase-like glycosyltransferase
VTPYRWLVAALFAALTIPRLAQLGMFSDGVLYASVARNLAEGNGSFWSPAYTQTLYPRFHEHPPLALGLQSLAFRLAGDHPAVERTYSVACGAIAALLIAALWRRTIRDARGDWLPVLFWLVPAVVTWSIVNNMLETTQAVFTTAAVWMALAAMSGPLMPIASGAAAVLAAAAVLVKGPVGLFPLAAPALYAALIDRRETGRAVIVTMTMAAVLVAIGAVLVWNRPSREALDTYLHAPVMASLSGARELAPSRWRVVSIVGADILLRMAALLAIVWLILRRPRMAVNGERWMWFFFTLALCASVPIAVRPKLMGHYFVPSVPLFAIAFALPAWRWIEERLERPRARVAAIVAGTAAVVLFLLTIAIPLVHGPVEARDAGLLQVIRTLGPSLPRGGVVGTCAALAADWPIHAYLQRFYRVSLDARGAHPLYLRASDPACSVPDGCLLVRFASGLELYSCGEAVTREP